MVLTIYDKKGGVKLTVSPDTSSTQQQQIEGDDILGLSFEHYECLELEVGDYTEFMGTRYELLQKYRPEEVSSVEWRYSVNMYGGASLLKRFLVLEHTDGAAEPIFTLTAPAQQHLKMIVECLNTAMNTTEWKAGMVEGTKNIVVDYQSTYCDEALSSIAEQLETEWWVDGRTINLCRCEQGELLSLRYGEGLRSLSADASNTTGFYTRLYPIGSERNIDKEKYGHTRLQLPNGEKYLDVHTDVYGIYDRAEQQAFADIYPRRTGTINAVVTAKKRNDDGTYYDVFYFQDSSLDFNPNDYLLNDETLRVSFQSGELLGLGQSEDHYFEVNYDSKTKQFEIITIWPYDDDTQLPGGSLKPKPGDTYILWNLRMPDKYVTAAEKELLEAAKKYNEEQWKDCAVYKGSIDHVWLEGLLGVKNAYSVAKDTEIYLGRRVRLSSTEYFPQGYSDTRITRIVRKLSCPTDLDIEMSDKLQQGTLDRLSNAVKSVRTSVASLSVPDVVKSWESTEPSDFNVASFKMTLKQIAKRALSRLTDDNASGVITFLKDIIVKGRGKFAGAVDVGGDATVTGTASVGKATVSGDVSVGGNESVTGRSESESYNSDVVVSKSRNDAIEDLQGGMGFKMWMEDGMAKLIVDQLYVRVKAIFAELEVRKLTYSAGNLNLSGAGAKIVATADVGADGLLYGGSPIRFFIVGGRLITDNGSLLYIEDQSVSHNVTATCTRCYFLADDGGEQTEQTFKVGDMVMCRTFDVKAGVYKDVENRYYWRTCVGVSAEPVTSGGKKYHWIDLSLERMVEIGDVTGRKYNDGWWPGYDTNGGVENDVPKAGDDVAQVGHLWDRERQNVVQLVAVGSDAPAINLYEGINGGETDRDKDGNAVTFDDADGDEHKYLHYSPLSSCLPISIKPYGIFVKADYLKLVNGSAETTITKLLDDIENDLDARDKKLTDRVMAVETSVDGIGTRVTATEEDGKEMKKSTTELTQKYNSIGATVSENKRDADGKISTLESSLKATSELIMARVSSQRAGRNMWVNGDFEMSADKAPAYAHNTDGAAGELMGVNGYDVPGGFTRRLVFTSKAAYHGVYFKGTQKHLELKKGQSYCLSFFAKTDTKGETAQMSFGIEGIKTESVAVGNSWQRFAMYVVPESDVAAMDVTVVFYPLADISGYVCMTGIQFECGSASTGAPTVWSRGLETDDAISELEVTAKGIRSTVEENEKRLSSVEQSSSRIKAEVRDEEKSAGLEITTDGVRLNGDKTEITGDLQLGGSFWGVLRRKAVTIDGSNYGEYIDVGTDGAGGSTAVLKLEKVGSYVIFAADIPSFGENGITVVLPTIPRDAYGRTFDADGEYATFEDWARYVRTFVGTRIMAYNYSSNTIYFTGMPLSMSKLETGDKISGISVFRYDKADGAFVMHSGCFAAFECVATTGYGNDTLPDGVPEERVVWDASGGLMASKNSKYVQSM